jgi:sugar-specific transcriptional regulator TrmB
MENSKEIQGFLKKSGLEEKESKVYLYLLTHGPQHVSILAKACGLTRTHGYDIVRKLEQKGLCYNLGSLYGRKIKANSQAHILSLLEQREKEVMHLKNDFRKILPLFEKLEIPKRLDTNEVSYFKGSESIKKMLSLLLQDNTSLRWAGSELDLIDYVGESFVEDFHTQRIERKIKLQLLLPEGKRGRTPIFKDTLQTEVRIRPKGEIRLKSNLLIWNTYVAFMSLKDDDFATLIDNERLAIMLSTWFDFIWASSKKSTR